MRIALLGYGKMGKTIEQIALEHGHTISYRINLDNHEDLEKVNSGTTDVAIEFSQPEAAFQNIVHCFKNGVPVVSGTTGWLDKMNEAESICKEEEGTFFYASNFSIGVNIFFRLNEILAKMMNQFDEYDVEMDEIHHIHKKDAPSGTALTLAEGIFKNLKSKNNWTLEPSQNKNDLYIHSVREGEVPGTHGIVYKSAIDNIEIKHVAHSRHGFALGAVKVAEWLVGKKGIYSMQDFLKL